MKQKKPYTAAELKAFDRLTMKLSSRNQLHRIEARMKLSQLLKFGDRAKYDAMFAVLKARDAR